MNDSRTFQDVILRLLDYWKARGCLVQQPYNVQVGAGTMNPATALRVLGQEPWNVVYVEPSVRPDDGRFGDNPNRLQMHHQLQVILKPDPGDPQQIYLNSLKAIGIDPRRHDIRFVEDNWESPALGAWGLGWEVWLDGQEITQFTYFQQAGSINLDPVSVEITYGLDRIILALQDKESVWKIDYNDRVQYDQVFLQSEIEHCRYYFEVADVDALRAIYDSYERESQRCLDAQLVVPAHDYNLKCSHLFNVLDTRGAIGVTERANYFKRMRNKARQISELYLEQRQRLEFPLLDDDRPWIVEDLNGLQPDRRDQQIEPIVESGPQTFVLEIGCEELPPDDVDGALRQLKSQIVQLLTELRLHHAGIEVAGTPRRLAVIVRALAERQPDVEEEVKGPPANRAFDAAGEPTRAATGFARSKGIDVADLRVVEDGDKSYVVATVREAGRATEEVLAEALPALIEGLKFPKSMRWNGSNVFFSRPLRWYVALFGARLIEFKYAGVTSGRTSRGLRPYGSPRLTIAHADRYQETLYQNNVMLQVQERSDYIERMVNDIAAAEGGRVPQNPELLQEVTNLVEFPTPFIGSFEERYLELPSEILVAVMRKHQRYFPVYDAAGNLINRFIAVRNGDSDHLDTVRHGNEQVIRARFADAEFFYSNDRRRQLTDFVADLEKLTFQSELGSMRDKLERLKRLTPAVADLVGLTDEERTVAERAAALAKADLATMMVVEMTSLQGVMGQVYARQSGESEAVAAAIGEQYESVSATRPGLALAIADRIDSLVGLAAAGLLPKGANDPFALRRASIQLIENLVANQVGLDLRQLVQLAAGLQPIEVSEQSQREVLAFIRTRLENLLRDRGYRASVIRAVLNAQPYDPAAAARAVADLSQAVELPSWESLLDAYARTARITRSQNAQLTVDGERLEQQETRELWNAYRELASTRDGSVPTLVNQIEALEPAITRFFDNVLVMADDEQLREQRLAVLQHIAALADGVADLSELEGF